MVEKRPRIKPGMADPFDRKNSPKSSGSPKIVFSLRLDAGMVTLIDQARDVYSERIATAIGRASVARESRSSMIRILLEDALRGLLGADVFQKKGGR